MLPAGGWLKAEGRTRVSATSQVKCDANFYRHSHLVISPVERLGSEYDIERKGNDVYLV